MHAASREALAQVESLLDGIISGSTNAVAISAQTGTELFDAVEILDGDRALLSGGSGLGHCDTQGAVAVEDQIGRASCRERV